MSDSVFERETRLAMAVKLFETGKLTSGQAARLATMSRVDFLYELGRFGVSPIQMEPDELEEDVKHAMKAYDWHQQQSGN
jgi:predicted HTH domain antitoxin